ncbi:27 kDa hemolymph protein-like [Adelges cooleyi]|uniref:27 kDa hemolymph protein-like n=1 Tax=Adelges cooleyi TaxID=133065 RepID=UPI00218046FE|nr:27 kDa hemolymph protein-like [Adelges cooleyi]
MKNSVLPAVAVVVLVISNNVSWGVVNGSQGENDDLRGTIEKKLGALGNLSNMEQRINSSIPETALEDSEKLFREKCLRNGKDNNSYGLAVEAKERFQLCVQSLVNVKELKKEIDEAKPKGDIDLVFKKYCKKSPDFKSCVSNFASAVEVCLDDGEKATKNTLLTVTDALLEFVCYDEGDRIALFYSESGPECLMGKQDGIQRCLNATFSKYTANNDLPPFKFERDQCKSMADLQLCVDAHLTKCSNLTPSNMVESLFKFIRRSTPCSQLKN